MSIKHIISSAFLACVALMSQAQYNLPKTTVGGRSVYYYEVTAGESIYDIAAKLGVTKDEIIKNNPDAADGIEKGMKLYFPVSDTDANVAAVAAVAASSKTASMSWNRARRSMGWPSVMA